MVKPHQVQNRGREIAGRGQVCLRPAIRSRRWLHAMRFHACTGQRGTERPRVMFAAFRRPAVLLNGVLTELGRPHDQRLIDNPRCFGRASAALAGQRSFASGTASHPCRRERPGCRTTRYQIKLDKPYARLDQPPRARHCQPKPSVCRLKSVTVRGVEAVSCRKSKRRDGHLHSEHAVSNVCSRAVNCGSPERSARCSSLNARKAKSLSIDRCSRVDVANWLGTGNDERSLMMAAAEVAREYLRSGIGLAGSDDDEAGEIRFSVPSPYVTHEPMLGREEVKQSRCASPASRCSGWSATYASTG